MDFCVLCWRRKYTKYYCRYHLGSGETRNNQQHHKRRLIRELNKRNIKIDTSLAKADYLSQLYKFTYKFSVKPSVALCGVKYPSLGVEAQARVIWAIASKYYPVSYLKLRQIDLQALTGKNELVTLITQALEERIGDATVKVGIDTATLELDATVWIPKVIELLARYESFQNLELIKVKPGPPRRYKEDTSLRKRLAARINELDLKGEKYTLEQLSKEFNLSSARICVLRKQVRHIRYDT